MKMNFEKSMISIVEKLFYEAQFLKELIVDIEKFPFVYFEENKNMEKINEKDTVLDNEKSFVLSLNKIDGLKKVELPNRKKLEMELKNTERRLNNFLLNLITLNSNQKLEVVEYKMLHMLYAENMRPTQMIELLAVEGTDKRTLWRKYKKLKNKLFSKK